MGRPEKEINWDLVEKLMEAGCNAKEIAGKFRMDPDTFYIRFKKKHGVNFTGYSVNANCAGDADLRLSLHAKAINTRAPGNQTLLQFLGRTRLGLREPELLNILAANQQQIDQTHTIMQLQHRIAELEANANKPQTE